MIEKMKALNMCLEIQTHLRCKGFLDTDDDSVQECMNAALGEYELNI